MITIPTWLFVIIVTLSSLFVLCFVITLIGYIRMCIADKHDKDTHPGK